MPPKQRKLAAAAARRRTSSRSKPAAGGADLAMDYEYMQLDSQSVEFEQGWMETAAAQAMGKSAANAMKNDRPAQLRAHEPYAPSQPRAKGASAAAQKEKQDEVLEGG